MGTARGRAAQAGMLEKVITEALDNKVKIAGKLWPCIGVALCPLNGVDTAGDPLHSVAVAGYETAAEIADTMLGIAETNASGSDSKVSYHLVFFYGEGKEADRPRKPFKFSVYSTLSLGAEGTEEANLKGIVKTVMARETEISRMMLSQINTMQEAAVNMVEVVTRALHETNQKLEMAKDDREAAIELLVQQRYVLENKAHEYRVAEIDRQGKAQLMARAVEMAPALINSFASKPVLPEETAATGALKLILSDLEKMDPALRNSLFGALSPMTMSVVMGLGIAMQKKNKEEADKAAAAIKAAGESVTGPETPIAHTNGQGGAS